MNKRSGASFCMGVIAVLLHTEVMAQYRASFDPSMQVSMVNDDNLFSSAETPARDVIQRFSPALALRLNSPLWSVVSSYSFDNDRFASNSNLSNRRARQRAEINADYQPAPRLKLGLEGAYADTDTPAELNVETGLAAARVRAKLFSFRPSVRFTISPRLTAHAFYLSTHTKLTDGHAIGSRFQTLGLDHRVTPRDLFMLDYEQGSYVFDAVGTTNTTTNTYVLQGGWAHDLDSRTRLTFHAGPRVTDHSAAAELSASLTRAWATSSIDIGASQTQAAAIGSVGVLEARSLSARFTYAPSRSLTAYAAPAVVRSVRDDLHATVYRIGLGAHYAITALIGLDVAYTHDSQHGAIDRLRELSNFSHRVLSVSLTTHWKGPDLTGAGRLR